MCLAQHCCFGGKYSVLHCVSPESISTQSWLYVGPGRSGSLVHCLNIVSVLWPQQTGYVFAEELEADVVKLAKVHHQENRCVLWGRRVPHGIIFPYKGQYYLHAFSSFVFLYDILNLVVYLPKVFWLWSLYSKVFSAVSSALGVNTELFSQRRWAAAETKRYLNSDTVFSTKHRGSTAALLWRPNSPDCSFAGGWVPVYLF